MEVTNNKQQFRYEILLADGEIASLEYRWLKGSMVLMRTFVPVSGRGGGVAATLVKHVLDHARTHGLKIIVYCGYVSKYMEKHPEYNDLLDEAHKR